MKRFLILLLALSLTLAACQNKPVEVTGQQVSVEGRTYTNVSADELNTLLKNKDFVFVNVHIPFAGNIENTDLSIPYDQIAEPSYLSQLPADKNARIVLYCRSGSMSAISADALVKLGYTNIWNLEGGMVGWERAGFEIQDK
ncbi:MAG: rhodanese-like domain-containing protein [Anaerolineales bacterium]|nr:rhodanese-like domain-containing protein [Anaerolineales bacterium]